MRAWVFGTALAITALTHAAVAQPVEAPSSTIGPLAAPGPSAAGPAPAPTSTSTIAGTTNAAPTANPAETTTSANSSPPATTDNSNTTSAPGGTATATDRSPPSGLASTTTNLPLVPAVLGKIGELRTGSNPKQVAFTPDGTELWVTLLGGRGVEVFSATTLQRTDQIRLGRNGAVEVIFNKNGTRAYISQMETASVYEVDRISRRVLRTMPTGGTWTKVMALSRDESTLYAANWSSNDVSEIDLRTGRVLRRIKTVHTPRGLALSSDGTRLYVAGFENGELQSIDLRSGGGFVLVRTGGAMRHLAVDSAGQRLYADDMGTDETFVVDMTTNAIRRLAPTESHPNTIDLSPDGRMLFVSNRGQNHSAGYNIPGPEWGSVLVIDTKTGSLLDAVIGGNQPTGLDVSPDGRTLAFTDFLDNRVQLYSIPPLDALLAANGGRAATYKQQIPKRAAQPRSRTRTTRR